MTPAGKFGKVSVTQAYGNNITLTQVESSHKMVALLIISLHGKHLKRDSVYYFFCPSSKWNRCPYQRSIKSMRYYNTRLLQELGITHPTQRKQELTEGFFSKIWQNQNQDTINEYIMEERTIDNHLHSAVDWWLL